MPGSMCQDPVPGGRSTRATCCLLRCPSATRPLARGCRDSSLGLRRRAWDGKRNFWMGTTPFRSVCPVSTRQMVRAMRGTATLSAERTARSGTVRDTSTRRQQCSNVGAGRAGCGKRVGLPGSPQSGLQTTGFGLQAARGSATLWEWLLRWRASAIRPALRALPRPRASWLPPSGSASWAASPPRQSSGVE